MKLTIHLLFLPALLLLVPFLVVPLMIVLGVTFNLGQAGTEWAPFSNYRNVLFDSYYLTAFGRTIALGLGTTLGCMLLSVPLAYWMFLHPKWRMPLVLLLTGPLLVNVIARLYGWQLLLSDSGPVNSALISLFGWTSPIYFTGHITGVVIVMLHVMLPYMTIAVFNSMQAIPDSVIEAATTLGAKGWSIFWRVALPISTPGLVSGGIIVFSLASSSFIIPAVMGGGKITTLPTLIYDEAMSLNYQRAATLSACLMLILLPMSWISRMFNRKSK